MQGSYHWPYLSLSQNLKLSWFSRWVLKTKVELFIPRWLEKELCTTTTHFRARSSLKRHREERRKRGFLFKLASSPKEAGVVATGV